MPRPWRGASTTMVAAAGSAAAIRRGIVMGEEGDRVADRGGIDAAPADVIGDVAGSGESPGPRAMPERRGELRRRLARPPRAERQVDGAAGLRGGSGRAPPRRRARASGASGPRAGWPGSSAAVTSAATSLSRGPGRRRRPRARSASGRRGRGARRPRGRRRRPVSRRRTGRRGRGLHRGEVAAGGDQGIAVAALAGGRGGRVEIGGEEDQRAGAARARPARRARARLPPWRRRDGEDGGDGRRARTRRGRAAASRPRRSRRRPRPGRLRSSGRQPAASRSEKARSGIGPPPGGARPARGGGGRRGVGEREHRQAAVVGRRDSGARAWRCRRSGPRLEFSW